MSTLMSCPWRTLFVVGIVAFTAAQRASSAPVVPGTGQPLPQVGDDFEDPNWGFVHNFPKSSEEIDELKRHPTGFATNRRWYEGIKRGQPDFLKRVPTPEEGLPHSQGALLIRTRDSGVPGRRSYKMEQDDFVLNCHQNLRSTIPVSQSPNCVVRVYMPPFEQWENRNGPSFGFRVAVQTHAWKEPDEPRGFFNSRKKEFLKEVYWPGLFVQFRSETDPRFENDSAYFTIRGNQRGADFRGPQITQTGWWTMGISCSPDGQIHYYAKPGVDDLTPEDRIGSQYPYGYKAEQFRTMFFNVCNRDDGRTWSTPWIIDDATIYVSNPQLAGRRTRQR